MRQASAPHRGAEEVEVFRKDAPLVSGPEELYKKADGSPTVLPLTFSEEEEEWEEEEWEEEEDFEEEEWEEEEEEWEEEEEF